MKRLEIKKPLIPFFIILGSISISTFLYIRVKDLLFQLFTPLGQTSAMSVLLILTVSLLFIKFFFYINRILGGEEIDFSKKTPGQNKPITIKDIRFIILSIVLSSAIASSVVYYRAINNGTLVGVTLNDVDSVEYPNSSYVRVDNDVYFLKAGYGYYKLENADADSFAPFSFDHQYGSAMGHDQNHVFSGHLVISGINKNKVVYLGKHYVRDDKSIFYGDTQITGADIETFQQLTFDTNYSLYSKDKDQVFYKNKRLPNADVNSIDYAGNKQNSYINNYIKDKQNAYYQNSLLEHVDAKNFVAESLTQTLSYASDGKKYFVNGIPFPKVVKNKFYGTATPNLDAMILLQKTGVSHFHMLFSDNKGIYYFDEQKQTFIHAKNLVQKASFQSIDNGVFSDGEFIYFTSFQKIKSYRTGITGHISYIFKSQLRSDSFRKLKTIKGATIYQYKNDYYLTINEHPSLHVNASLVKLKGSNLTNNSIGHDRLENINDASLILKFKTRF